MSTKHMSRLARPLTLILSLVFAAATAFGQGDGARRLVDWETRGNGAGERPNGELKLLHYEVPLTEVMADVTAGIDPKAYDALVFEKNGQKYVRWVINPEDSRWHIEVAEWLKKKGLDATPKEYFKGFFTASRSMIVVDPANGFEFSLKMSTNKTGGAWRDKKQPVDDAMQSRMATEFIKSTGVEAAMKHTSLLTEPLMFGLQGVDQAIIMRSLEPLRKGTTYLLPGFSALHEKVGVEIARLNGSDRPAEFWGEHYNKALARSIAEFAAHTGLTFDSPHSQNFLIELDANLKPTGKIVIRDFVDTYAHRDFFEGAGNKDFLTRWDSGNVTKSLNVAIGVLHGNKNPSWIDMGTYNKWGREFYETFERTYSEITGVSQAEMAKIRLSEPGGFSYFSKYYNFNEADTQKIRDHAGRVAKAVPATVGAMPAQSPCAKVAGAASGAAGI